MEVLNERASTHGDFDVGSAIEQSLKEVVRKSPNWMAMSSAQRSALEMICHKMSRILAGDHNFLDSYRDIAGYAQLALNYTAMLPGATDVTVTRSKVNEQL